MENVLIILAIIAFDLSFAFLFGNLANRKGYPGIAWGAIGFFLPILYLIILLVPDRNTRKLSKKEREEQERNYKTTRSVAIAFISFALLIGLIWCISNASSIPLDTEEAEDAFTDYVLDYLVDGYLAVQTDNYKNKFEDQKVYVQDLYNMYVDDEFDSYPDFVYDNDNIFVRYYEKYEDEVEDDYVIVVNEPEDSEYIWNAYYYYEEDSKAEMEDYTIDYAIVRYEEDKTNGYQNDVVSEKVPIKTLYEKGYLSPYFRHLYENPINSFNSFDWDYIEITAKGGREYDKVYK